MLLCRFAKICKNNFDESYINLFQMEQAKHPAKMQIYSSNLFLLKRVAPHVEVDQIHASKQCVTCRIYLNSLISCFEESFATLASSSEVILSPLIHLSTWIYQVRYFLLAFSKVSWLIPSQKITNYCLRNLIFVAVCLESNSSSRRNFYTWSMFPQTSLQFSNKTMKL